MVVGYCLWLLVLVAMLLQLVVEVVCVIVLVVWSYGSSGVVVRTMVVEWRVSKLCDFDPLGFVYLATFNQAGAMTLLWLKSFSHLAGKNECLFSSLTCDFFAPNNLTWHSITKHDLLAFFFSWNKRNTLKILLNSSLSVWYFISSLMFNLIKQKTLWSSHSRLLSALSYSVFIIYFTCWWRIDPFCALQMQDRAGFC